MEGQLTTGHVQLPTSSDCEATDSKCEKCSLSSLERLIYQSPLKILSMPGFLPLVPIIGLGSACLFISHITQCFISLVKVMLFS